MPPLAAASFAWTRLGAQWMEMAAASAQAFSQRATRQNTPAQVFEMGSEKLLASIESSSAMARRMMVPPAADPLAMWSAWLQVLASGMTPYRVRAVRNARRGRRAR